MKASKRLTVLLFCHSARLAGAQLSLLSMARALDARDFRVVVVLPEQGELTQLFNASKIPVIYCHYGFSLYTSPIEKVATYPATVSRVLDVITSVQPDVCYVNSGVLLHVAAACLLSLGQRVILRVGAIFEDQTQPFDDHAREEALLYPLCPVIHTPSQWLREWLVTERGVPLAQVVPIPSFGEGDTLPARAPRSPNHFQMLCTLDDNKGPDLFIRAAAQLRALAPRHATTFQINGDGPEEYRAYLHRLVEEYKLADCFTIGPPIVRVAQLYQRARAVLILSKMEGFGGVPVEAAYYGVPVITTQCRGAQEIVEPEQTGLWLETREAGEVAGAMLRLLDDEALAQRLGQQAQVVYLQRFAPGVVVPQYIKLLQEVAAGVYPAPRLDILAQQSIWRYLLDMSQRAQDEWANRLAEKEQAAQALSVQMAAKEQAVQGLSAQVAQRDEVMAALQMQVAEKKQVIQVLSEQLAAKDAQIERITSSLGWRLLSYYGRIKYWILSYTQSKNGTA